MARVQRPNVIERRMSRLLRKPPTVKAAAGVIVTATVGVVVLGAIVMRLIDDEEFRASG
jgi:hypothetical protein